jgi:hypothetical protein
MEDTKDWFLRFAQSSTNIEEIHQVARLIHYLEREIEHSTEYRQKSALTAAIVADICETLFGSNANGAPMIMAAEHAGWACSPGSKSEKSSYVRWALESWDRSKSLKENVLEEIKEWEDFIEKLGRVAINSEAHGLKL